MRPDGAQVAVRQRGTTLYRSMILLQVTIVHDAWHETIARLLRSVTLPDGEARPDAGTNIRLYARAVELLGAPPLLDGSLPRQGVASRPENGVPPFSHGRRRTVCLPRAV